jgi:small subunit ribosomal protein S2
MRKQPDAIFIVDLRKEQLAVREARRLGMPVIALVDTNCDPDEADFVIPGNDDAIRSCSLVVHALGEAISEGKQRAKPDDFAPASAEETQPEPEPEPQPEPEAEAAPEPAAEAEGEPEAEPVPVPDAPEEAS